MGDIGIEQPRRPRPGPGATPVAAVGVAPGPEVPAGPPRVSPTRRAALIAGLAGLAVTAGFGLDDRADARHTGAGTPPASSGAAGSVAARPVAAVRHRARPAAAWRAPVRSLDDYRRHVPHTAFAPRAVMLTLDDGPHPVWTPRMLDLLSHLGVTATFFVIGSQVRANRALVHEAIARGHVVGNHTWSHDEALGTRSASRIREEIDRTNHAVHDACGHVPTQFRAPGGTWTPQLLRVLAERRLVPVDWDVDPADWSRPGVTAIERTLLRARPHDIALCHDGGGDRSQTYRALRTVLPALQRRGVSFTTLPSAR